MMQMTPFFIQSTRIRIAMINKKSIKKNKRNNWMKWTLKQWKINQKKEVNLLI